jgi:very-short-patch-repair endonuclease
VLHPDLKWPHWRILLEYEGDGHRENRERWKRDIARKGDFEAAGWLVIRVTADDLFVDRKAFLARVRGYIRLAESRLRAH